MTVDEALRDKQRKFAAEQAATSRELDALHRRLHPEKHVDQPTPKAGPR